ncbi:MAG: head decoration protein [Comamonadaceae bacterium CG_4_9_14_0_8_um_filter_57_21]|nr:MAG: head decoration protein [Comamonadaceae bacterium CG_4_9_14_0_8_um_filter_57_21]
MTNLVEGFHTGEYLVSEADGTLSREEVTVTQAGTALVSGTVMGKVTVSGKYVPYSNTAADGSEVAAGVLYTSCEAATGDRDAVVHVRNCEVFGAALTGSDANSAADLKALNVIVR